MPVVVLGDLIDHLVERVLNESDDQSRVRHRRSADETDGPAFANWSITESFRPRFLVQPVVLAKLSPRDLMP